MRHARACALLLALLAARLRGGAGEAQAGAGRSARAQDAPPQTRKPDAQGTPPPAGERDARTGHGTRMETETDIGLPTLEMHASAPSHGSGADQLPSESTATTKASDAPVEEGGAKPGADRRTRIPNFAAAGAAFAFIAMSGFYVWHDRRRRLRAAVSALPVSNIVALADKPPSFGATSSDGDIRSLPQPPTPPTPPTPLTPFSKHRARLLRIATGVCESVVGAAPLGAAFASSASAPSAAGSALPA